jgi:hypothetical protein
VTRTLSTSRRELINGGLVVDPSPEVAEVVVRRRTVEGVKD